MTATLTVHDETTAGEKSGGITLEFLTENISVRELIRSRVFREVKDYNTKQPDYFRGLVQPTEAEQTLNGYKLRRARQIDWQEQYDAALDAFETNRFLVLVNDRQLEDLDEEITITPETDVSFLKLVPLVGG